MYNDAGRQATHKTTKTHVLYLCFEGKY